MFLYNEIVENAVPIPNAHHHFFENTGALNNTFRSGRPPVPGRMSRMVRVPFTKGTKFPTSTKFSLNQITSSCNSSKIIY